MLRVLTQVPIQLLGRVERELPEVELIAIPMQGELPAEVCGDVLLTHAKGSANLASVVARGVRWVHAYGTGVNEFPFGALGGRPLSCSRGSSAIPIAEWTLAVMLAAEKKLPASWIHEPPAHWSLGSLGGLYGKTLGIIGIGGIGQAVAARALPFGMQVRAFRRSAVPSLVLGVEIVRDLGDLLASADHLVVAAAATRATERLLGDAAFAQMKPGVHLVNVARGALVDHEALRRALDDGRIGLASLDCVDPEPLPAGHWLYTHPRVRLSPHISWSMPGAFDLLIEPFIDNLQRDLRGEPLIHLVDRELGY